MINAYLNARRPDVTAIYRMADNSSFHKREEKAELQDSHLLAAAFYKQVRAPEDKNFMVFWSRKVFIYS
jgi:hypothetical protein